MRRVALIVVLVAAVIGAASAGAPSTVIFPERRTPLVFSHQDHLALGTTTCIDCHAAAPTSRSAVDVLMPGEAACRTCHAIDRAKQEGCETCHVGFVKDTPPARVYVPPPNLKFSHEAHVSRGQACTACHGALTDRDLAGRDALPTMASCFTCHDGEAAPNDCATCHLTDLGKLRTSLPHGELAPSGQLYGDAHDLAFTMNHADAASRDAGYCASCHEESDCLECHAGFRKPDDFHGGDYVMLHAVDARRNDPDCSTCHRQQTFCVGCHQRSGVGGGDTAQHDQDFPDRAFHPAGWETEHASEARANLDACASCHREDECLECHTAEPGSLQVNPHGPGWRGSARCEALASRNPRMCTRCHITEGEMGCDF